MTRTHIPFAAPDISSLARHLARELAETSETPGHLQLMNMLARGAGFRNFQHFRTSAAEEGRLSASPAPVADMTRVARARRHFDADGRMTSWPARTSLQHLCLWVLWARLPRAVSMSEREISAELTRWHAFDDPAILRRTLWELKLISRTPDGLDYHRIEQAPPPEARALIGVVLRGAERIQPVGAS